MTQTFDPMAVERFVREADRDKPAAEQPTFVLRMLTTFDHMALLDEFGEGRASANPNQFAFAQVARALDGFENVKTRRGLPATFVRARIGAGAERACIEDLEYGLIIDVFRRVQEREVVTAEQTGKH